MRFVTEPVPPSARKPARARRLGLPTPALGSTGCGRRHRAPILAAVFSLFAVMAGCGQSQAPQQSAPGPQARPQCSQHDALRRPHFGDLHVHTRFSLDTVAFDLRNGPAEAYAFARGETVRIGAPGANGEPPYAVRLGRPLDFVAVTDHAEYLGATSICTDPSAAGYQSPECQLVRREAPLISRQHANLSFQIPAFGSPGPSSQPLFCLMPGVDCAGATSVQWQEIQRAAEEAYDRSSACRFTSFVGFEWTATPLGSNLHRNVIFRSEAVTPLPISVQDTGGPNVETLWRMLETQCQQGGTGCDALVIPHNSNLSNGMMFEDPQSPEAARTRARMEPLVEIIQHKGASECRLGVGTSDEQCGFERTFNNDLFPRPESVPSEPRFEERAFIRNVLKDGLQLRERYGLNPFKLGFIGSTDTHFGTPGRTDEAEHLGHHHVGDDQPAQLIEEIDSNPGGLAVVWAEENSRDSLFAALRRRETYGTSGQRPVLRVFGGWSLPPDLCRRADFTAVGYRDGVPMGADLRPRPAGATGGPRFAVSALQDPIGLPLERIQIVKGWVDDHGQTHEQVFDVAGTAVEGLGVDPESCEPDGQGAPTLCAVWEDPAFEPMQPAFYYVRLLDAPSCRWSSRLCQSQGVNPLSEQCAAQAEQVGGPYAACCDTQTIEPVIQERAWSSPIWYEP